MQVLSIVVIVAIHGTAGTFSVTDFLIAMPALVLGTLIGSFFFGKIDDLFFRRVVLILLVISGFGLVW